MPRGWIVGAAAVLAPALPGDLRQGPRNGDGTLAQLLRPGQDSLLYHVSRQVFHLHKYNYLSDSVKGIPARKTKILVKISDQGGAVRKISPKNSSTLQSWAKGQNCQRSLQTEPVLVESNVAALLQLGCFFEAALQIVGNWSALG